MSNQSHQEKFPKYLKVDEKDGEIRYFCEKCGKELIAIKDGEVVRGGIFYSCKHFTIQHLNNEIIKEYPEWFKEYKEISIVSVNDKKGRTFFIIPRYSAKGKVSGKIYIWDLPTNFSQPFVVVVKIPVVPMIIVMYGLNPILTIADTVTIRGALKKASEIFERNYRSICHTDNPFQFILDNIYVSK